MADVWGLIPSQNGLIHIEIEIKTGTGRQSKAQKVWEKFIQNMGGIYIVAREPDQTINELKSLIQGIPTQ